MAKLFGAQRLVLQAILDLPKDAAGFVTDRQIAQSTRIAPQDVKDWIETLDGEGLVEVAATLDGLTASITAKGRLQLSTYHAITGPQNEPTDAIFPEPVQPHPFDRIPPLNSGAAAASVNPSIEGEPLVPIVSPEAGASSVASTSDGVDAFQVVLLIHGIRTEADWGPMVKSKLEVPGKIEVIPIRYGYFDAFRFWFPFWTRNKPIERVYKQIRVALQKYRKTHPDAKLSIIAHSYGTYIIGEILKRGFDLQFHRLILCGSVLRQDFAWEQYQGRFDDDKVVNECGKADIWPVLAQSASWGYGASGTHGFGAVLVKDRFHAGGHGQYFEPAFVEKYWEPFIRRGKYEGTDFELKMPPTPWWVSVLGILPLKWLIVVIVLAAAIVAGFFVANKIDGRQPVSSVVNGQGVDHSAQAAQSRRDLEISSFDFSEEYQKGAVSGGLPQFDLILRNAMSEPAVITGIRFNVKKTWKLEPTPIPLSTLTAEVLHPSAVYDVVVGRNDGDEQEGTNPAKVKDGQLSFRIVGINEDPKIETITKKVSHFIKAGEADRILLNYRVTCEMGWMDPQTMQPVIYFMVTPFYVIQLSVAVIYNGGRETESNDLMFAHLYDDFNRQFITDKVKEGDNFGRTRKERIDANLKAILEIEGSKAKRSPSVAAVVSLTKKLASKSSR